MYLLCTRDKIGYHYIGGTMTIGIYSLTNTIDNKRYIGKSINIESRFWSHSYNLSKPERDKKQVNRHLWNAVKKYGLENFKFETLEAHATLDENHLKDRELYFMDFYSSYDRNFGYNLRRDSSTNSIVHEETRALISKATKGSLNGNYGNKWTQEQRDHMSVTKKAQVAAGVYDWRQSTENKEKVSREAIERWKDKEKLAKMSEKVALLSSTLRFYEYDKITKELIKIWESMHEILVAHPDYHRIAIYSVCNGHKKSYRGSIWKSELKV